MTPHTSPFLTPRMNHRDSTPLKVTKDIFLQSSRDDCVVRLSCSLLILRFVLKDVRDSHVLDEVSGSPPYPRSQELHHKLMHIDESLAPTIQTLLHLVRSNLYFCKNICTAIVLQRGTRWSVTGSG